MTRARNRGRAPFGSDEHKRRNSEGQLRRLDRERPAPIHIVRWVHQGLVAEPLRRIVSERIAHLAEMVQDLGGEEHVTAMERAVLQGWLVAQVAADAEFGRYLRSDDPAALERVTAFINTARGALIALGLQRRERDVTPKLAEYIKRHDAETVAGAANAPGSDADPEPGDDRVTGAEESRP